MSLWDWLLAAWIYEELFDDESDSTLHGLLNLLLLICLLFNS